MIGMLRTRWPRRVHKRVMEVLLNVVNDPLLEVRRFIAEQTDPCRSLFDYVLVTRPDCMLEIF